MLCKYQICCVNIHSACFKNKASTFEYADPSLVAISSIFIIVYKTYTMVWKNLAAYFTLQNRFSSVFQFLVIAVLRAALIKACFLWKANSTFAGLSKCLENLVPTPLWSCLIDWTLGYWLQAAFREVITLGIPIVFFHHALRMYTIVCSICNKNALIFKQTTFADFYNLAEDQIQVICFCFVFLWPIYEEISNLSYTFSCSCRSDVDWSEKKIVYAFYVLYFLISQAWFCFHQMCTVNIRGAHYDCSLKHRVEGSHLNLVQAAFKNMITSS